MRPEKKQHGGPRPGAGRPAVYKQRAQFTITLDAALLARLDKRVEQAGLTRSVAVQEAIRTWLGKR